jgi:hypothetical protein
MVETDDYEIKPLIRIWKDISDLRTEARESDDDPRYGRHSFSDPVALPWSLLSFS